MSISRKLMTVGGDESTYVDDVFSTYLYEGKIDRQRITNGIALADENGPTAFNSLVVGSASTTTEITGYDWGNDIRMVNSTSWSIEFWVRHTAPIDAQMYLLDGRDDLTNPEMQIGWFGSLAMISQGVYWGRPGLSSEYLEDGSWNHIVWSKDGDWLSTFVNGIRYDAAASTAGYTFSTRINNTAMFQACQGTPYPLKGVELQDFRIIHSYTPYDPLATTIDVPTERLKAITGTTLLLFNGGDTLDEMLTNKADDTGEVGTALGGQISASSSSVYATSPKAIEGKGGMVWIKNREAAYYHSLYDTERGPLNTLRSSETSADTAIADSLLAFHGDGFGIGDTDDNVNRINKDYASWTFAKQKGFFDVVTYTGDGVAGRVIPHNLGSTPGMMIVKRSDGTGDWIVYHNALGATRFGNLNQTGVFGTNSIFWDDTEPTDSGFTVGAYALVNESGGEFVAYLFADDAPMFGPNGDESIIKCGSLDVSNYNVEEDLGWEPQWVLFKSATGTGDWRIIDNMRGSTDPQELLFPNKTDAGLLSGAFVEFTSRGFVQKQLAGSQQGIYMAIRRPNKPAEEFEPEELFATALRDSVTSDYESGFPVDMVLNRNPTSAGSDFTQVGSRLIQGEYLQTSNTAASAANFYMEFDSNTRWGYNVPANYQSWMFRRAPGFFDVVKYSGDGASSRQLPHNLGAVPQMVWYKRTNAASGWAVYTDVGGVGNYMYLDTSDFNRANPYMFPLLPTADHLELGYDVDVNGSGYDYVAFLFASTPGICDIGSYIGTGTDQDIDCGFTNGARFVLTKRVETSGGWHFFDTLRGITNASSPRLFLDTTHAELTASLIKPYSGGFTASSASVNVAGGEYLYMAIA